MILLFFFSLSFPSVSFPSIPFPSFHFPSIHSPISQHRSLTYVYLPYISRMNPVDSHIDVPLSYCNSDCICDKNQWEPVCGENGVTYISPCLAGCKSFRGDKKLINIEFYDCSCVSGSGFQKGNHSARLGECPRDKCKTKYYFYITFQVIISFFTALGSTSLMLILIR